MVEALNMIGSTQRIKVAGVHQKQNKSLQLLIGRNRILILNIMKFLNYRR